MILPSRYTKNIYHSYAGWGSYQFLEFSNELSGKSFKEFFDFSRKIETLSLMHPYNSNIVYDYLVVGPYLTEKLSVDDFQLLNKMEFLAQMANNIEDQWRHSYKPKGSTLNNISIIKELITNEIKVLIKDTE
ncbi:MAG TPA: hypothetical protein VFQ58_08570, partial [Flavisolibacter sp.]|nr:hypothetical protein [Flavisolibacter sp.]